MTSSTRQKQNSALVILVAVCAGMAAGLLAVIIPAALSLDTYELGDSLLGMVPFGALAGLVAGVVWVAVRERRT